MASEAPKNNEKEMGSRIDLKDVLTFLDMAMEGQPDAFFPPSADEIFGELTLLINKTVRATKIERFKPDQGTGPFHRFEIHSEQGEALGYLNTIYLRKPIPSYYLVYVEILPSLRGQGLGGRVLNTFKEYAESSRAVALLDNIILPQEPTYTLYTKLGWRPIEELIGHSAVDVEEHYMVYVPKSVIIPDLREKLAKLFFNVKKKRAIIDMQDNDATVKRTIKEFHAVYDTLRKLFEKELSSGISTPFMCFMFTKFVKKALGFRRRIARLLGYTGGESLEQISSLGQIKDLPILPYSLWSPHESQVEIWKEIETIRSFPEKLLKEPTFFIEDLPLYRRPYLSAWIEKRGIERSLRMKISDLIELGFDPTRLREFGHEGKDYVFERISPGLLPSVEKLRNLFQKISGSVTEIRLRNTALSINPPLAVFRDRGNVYVLRQKVEGIHLEEALDQLRTHPRLKEMNQTTGMDHVLIGTVSQVDAWLKKTVGRSVTQEIEDLTFFVSWEIERNLPRVQVDASGVSFDTLWIA